MAVVESRGSTLFRWNWSSSEKINDKFEQNRGNYSVVAGWIRDMPKGGNLHLHMLGALYPNDLLSFAITAGLYVDPDTLIFSNQPKDVQGKDLVPASIIRTDKTFLQKFLNTVSMRGDSGVTKQASCDHFMYTCFGPIASIAQYIDPAKLVAKVRAQEALSNASYVEMNVGLSALESLVDQFDKLDLDSRPLTRFICETSRIVPMAVFDKEIAKFAELQRKHPKYIRSLTIVGPEYDPVAMSQFKNQIQTLNHIWNQRTECGLTLHSGELDLTVATPVEVKNRLEETLKVPRIRRVGHGLSILNEENREEVIATFKANNIAVEVCLVSNSKTLHIEGKKHPLNYFLKNRVKVVLGSDDPGVFGTDLSEQFIIAFFDHGLTYLDLKKLAINSITHSFLSGESIFKENGELKPEFLGVTETGWSPNPQVSIFMNINEKCRMELALLQEFAIYEQKLSRPLNY